MVFEGLHSQTRHFNALNLTIQKTNYDKCLTVKNFTKQNLLFHYMSRNDEIEDLGFQDIFLALEVTYGIKFIQHQNQRHQCHHQARRSLLQEQLASFLLSGSRQGRLQDCIVQVTGASTAKLTLISISNNS